LDDGTANLLEGMSNTAPGVIQAFQMKLPSHLMPEMGLLNADLAITGIQALAKGSDSPLSLRNIFTTSLAGFEGWFKVIVALFNGLFRRQEGTKVTAKQRDYKFACTTPAATVAIYIGACGNDLYLCWDLFLRRVWNEVIIGMIIALALVIALYQGFTGAMNQLSQGSSLFAFLSILGIIPSFIFGAISFAVLLMIAGFLFKRDVWAFLTKEIDLFEAHNIGAMVLAVDKTLRQAADTVGIHANLLRAKEQFRVGRRERLI
jgi:hypothetical protein